MEEKLIPRKLYKFIDPYYLKQLEKKKEFYINHLNNYKEAELGTEIGDDLEGVLINEVQIDDYTFNAGTNRNPQFEQAFSQIQSAIHMGEGVTNITFKDVTFRETFNDRNYYVYCSCLEHDEVVKKEFGGATLVIEHFPKFLYHLNKELREQGIIPYYMGACRYITDRKTVFTESDETFIMEKPFMVKEKRYAYQKEFRILWKHKNGSTIKEPKLIKCPKALKYCSFEY